MMTKQTGKSSGSRDKAKGKGAHEPVSLPVPSAPSSSGTPTASRLPSTDTALPKLSPAFSPPSTTSARQAVNPAQVSVAASAGV